MEKKQKNALGTFGAVGSNDLTKETSYCILQKSARYLDESSGYTFAVEGIYIKNLKREEIRICLYKDMKSRDGKIKNKIIMRPVDMTEDELLCVLKIALQSGIFSDRFKRNLSELI